MRRPAKGTIAGSRSSIWIAFLLLGCASVPPTNVFTGPPASANEFVLPTTGPLQGCAGVEFDGRILLDVKNGETLARRPAGDPLRIFWPEGFTARFDGAIWRIIDDRGKVFASSGETISDYLRGNWRGRSVCTTTQAVYVYD